MRAGTLLFRRLGLAVCLLTTPIHAATANPTRAMQAFADNCFRPTMTAERAKTVLSHKGTRYDFYDLDPFVRSNAPSPALKRAVTPNTDRRCEVSFDGTHTDAAAKAAARGLRQEGIRKSAPIPPAYANINGATFVGARQLNPRRVAVVIVGTRAGPNGVETYMTVERLRPTGGN